MKPPASQLALDLTKRPALGRDDFFVTEANRLALARIEAWQKWPGAMLVLTGPAGSGKSHLAAVWAARAPARIVPAAEHPGDGPAAIEDLHTIAGDAEAEEALFHTFNRARAAGQPLLFTARAAPGRIGLRLPDLVSRLQSLDMAALAPPDDALLAAVLTKQLADRQLVLEAKVTDYIVTRTERRFDAIERLARELNRTSLTARRRITVPMARDVLERIQNED